MENKRDSFFMPNKKIQNGGHNEKKEFSKKRQEEFSKNRAIEKQDKSENVDKKPFDKKTYRLKKYSKKYKLEQWEEQRKKKLLHNYYKDIKNDPMPGSYKPKVFDEDTTDSSSIGRFVRHPDLIEKQDKNVKNPYLKAKEKYNRIKEEKLQKQQDVARAKEEREQKLQEYKKKKQERFKKLSKKTKKGQPVIKGRLEILLEKIQGGT